MSPLPYGIEPPNYRLPAATHLGRVRLQVTHLATSVKFYTEIMGFRVIAQHGNVVELGAHGDNRVIVELHAGATAPHPKAGRQGLFHFAILLPDRAALGRFLMHLVETDVQAGSSDHLVSEAIYLHDPDGLGIEVYADRPRAQWKHENRELAMTTIALDGRGVAAAAMGEPWTGMPAGTVLGHVHLHVADLDKGKSFYHAALGFDVVVWSYPGALFLSAGGYHHHLGTNTWAASQPTAAAHEARLLDWEVVVPSAGDVAEARKSVVSAGTQTADAEGGFSAADPWGTRVRVVAA